MSGISEAMANMAAGNSKRDGGKSISGKGEKYEGSRFEDSSLPSIHSHMKAMHREFGGGKSMHVHQHEDGTYTTHHADEEGKIHGPDEHMDHDGMITHLNHHLNQEADEASNQGHDGLM